MPKCRGGIHKSGTRAGLPKMSNATAIDGKMHLFKYKRRSSILAISKTYGMRQEKKRTFTFR
jgi:hypothetical protein